MPTFKRLVSAAVLISAAIAPIAVSAQSDDDERGTPQNFCTRITNVRSELNSKLSEIESNRGKNRTEILNKLKERKDGRSEDVQKKRDDGKQKFTGAIAKIEAEATTDAQKAALVTFKTSVNTALAARKTAVDAATLTFRNARDLLVAKRQDAVKAAGSTFKSSVLAAITKTQTACRAAGSDPVAIRQTLVTDIRTANTQFHTTVNASVGNISQQIKDLATVRNEAVKTANQAFKAAVGLARQTLKLAFPSA